MLDLFLTLSCIQSQVLHAAVRADLIVAGSAARKSTGHSLPSLHPQRSSRSPLKAFEVYTARSLARCASTVRREPLGPSVSSSARASLLSMALESAQEMPSRHCARVRKQADGGRECAGEGAAAAVAKVLARRTVRDVSCTSKSLKRHALPDAQETRACFSSSEARERGRRRAATAGTFLASLLRAAEEETCA